MAKDTIKRLMDRGFGFIQTAEGKDLFFHRSDLRDVEFEMGRGNDGRLQAVKVRVARPEGE